MRQFVFGILGAVCFGCAASAQTPVAQGAPNVPEFSPAFPQQTRAPAQHSDVALQVTQIAGGLDHPWGIAVLPEGGYLVTERSGQLRVIEASGAVRAAPVRGVPLVFARRQGGLLDVALATDFAVTRQIYLTYAKPMGGGLSSTAAARGTLSPDLSTLGDVVDIFVQQPPSPSPLHYGSRVVPDGDDIYVTTGEHSTPAERGLAQDMRATYGKVMRIRAGTPAIYSLGHRNMQGAAVHPQTGTLWTVEHGPRGGDELNVIAQGANYGWPVVSYGEEYSGAPIGEGRADHAAAGFVEPRYYWDPVIAPGGMVFYDGDLFADWRGDALIGSLNPGALVRLVLDGDTVVGEERVLNGIGRVRDVAQDRDGALLLLIDAAQGSVLRVVPTR